MILRVLVLWDFALCSRVNRSKHFKWSHCLGLWGVQSSAGTPQHWRRRLHGPARWYNLLTLLYSVTPQKTRIFEYYLLCNFSVSTLGLLYFSRQLTSRIHGCLIFTAYYDHLTELNVAVCLQVQICPYLGRLINALAVTAYTGSSIRSWWF
jgi:hypothetical protein